MHNKVAHTLARAFLRLGFSALRFNFRGTEGSEGSYDNGEGELDDALAALAWMRDSNPALPIWLAGFSFGAAIAVKAAAVRDVDGLVQGDLDELVDIDETVAWVDNLEPGPELLIVPGGEHFFHGRLVELRDAVVEFVERSQA